MLPHLSTIHEPENESSFKGNGSLEQERKNKMKRHKSWQKVLHNLNN